VLAINQYFLEMSGNINDPLLVKYGVLVLVSRQQSAIYLLQELTHMLVIGLQGMV